MPWYVKFDGVDGSSKQKEHIHWTNAASVNMGSHRPGGNSTGAGRSGSQMYLEDISIGILNDRGTPKLLEAAVKGKVFKTVEIHGTATYGDAGEQVYLAIKLENVQITSYQIGVLDNNAATDDMVLTLNFEKYSTKFTHWGADGSKGGNVEFEWKIQEGER